EHMVAKENGFRDYLQSSNRTVISKWLPDFNQTELLEGELVRLFADTKEIAGIFVTTSRISYVANILLKLNLLHLSLVGFDLVKSNIDLLPHFNKLFLIHQNPSLQGYYGLMQLFDHFLKKKEIRKKMFLPLDIITQENVQNHLHIRFRDKL
ncbi:MAG: hypothetical protein AAGJ18_10075, partial [Bacteroidota bacterium]